MEAKPQIPEFYAGKTVLVTGCTGFIGKVLIWKLLHSCPSIKQIYILLRLKGDKTIEDRQKEFFKCPIFDNFTSSNSNLLTKVIPVQGDVVVDNLGLSKSDEQMLVNNVSIVFYGAALLKMDATLKQAINVNTKGVIRCLDIALKMKKLTAFVYISTAYSCSEESYVEEKIYYMNENPATIIASLECLTQPMLDKITQDIIAPLPNTYTFSKRLTELLLVEYEAKLPVIIARPTIVVASHKEPIPGWIDNLNGAVGFGAAIGSGILHSMYIRKENRGDLVPVDIVCNTLIAIPWAEEKNILIKETPIYNIAVIDHEQVSWGLYAEIGEQAIMKYPFKLMLWYPTFHVFQSNWFLHKLEAIIYHWIPAYLIDFMLFLLGRKTL